MMSSLLGSRSSNTSSQHHRSHHHDPSSRQLDAENKYSPHLQHRPSTTIAAPPQKKIASPHQLMTEFAKAPQSLFIKTTGTAAGDPTVTAIVATPQFNTCIATFKDLMVMAAGRYPSMWAPVQFAVTIASSLHSGGAKELCKTFIEKCWIVMPGGDARGRHFSQVLTGKQDDADAVSTVVRLLALTALSTALDDLEELTQCCEDFLRFVGVLECDMLGDGNGLRMLNETQRKLIDTFVVHILSHVCRAVEKDPVDRFGMYEQLVEPVLQTLLNGPKNDHSDPLRVLPSSNNVLSATLQILVVLGSRFYMCGRQLLDSSSAPTTKPKSAALQKELRAFNFRKADEEHTATPLLAQTVRLPIQKESLATIIRTVTTAKAAATPSRAPSTGSTSSHIIRLSEDSCRTAASSAGTLSRLEGDDDAVGLVLIFAFDAMVRSFITSSQFGRGLLDAHTAAAVKAKTRVDLKELLDVHVKDTAVLLMARGSFNDAEKLWHLQQLVLGEVFLDVPAETAAFSMRLFAAFKSTPIFQHQPHLVVDHSQRVAAFSPSLCQSFEALHRTWRVMHRTSGSETALHCVSGGAAAQLKVEVEALLDCLTRTLRSATVDTLGSVEHQALLVCVGMVMSRVHLAERGTISTGSATAVAALTAQTRHAVSLLTIQNQGPSSMNEHVAPLLRTQSRTATNPTGAHKLLLVEGASLLATLHTLHGDAIAARKLLFIPLDLVLSFNFLDASMVAVALAPLHLFNSLVAPTIPPKQFRSKSGASSCEKDLASTRNVRTALELTRKEMKSTSTSSSFSFANTTSVPMQLLDAAVEVSALTQQLQESHHDRLNMTDTSQLWFPSYYHDVKLRCSLFHPSSRLLMATDYLFTMRRNVAGMLAWSKFTLHSITLDEEDERYESEEETMVSSSTAKSGEHQYPPHCFVSISVSSDAKLLHIKRKEGHRHANSSTTTTSVSIPLRQEGHNLLTETQLRMEQLQQQADDHIKESAASYEERFGGRRKKKSERNDRHEAKIQWWNERRRFDEDIGAMLQDVLHDGVLGPWRSLLLGLPADSDTVDDVRRLARKTAIELEDIVTPLLPENEDNGTTTELPSHSDLVAQLTYIISALPYFSPHYCKLMKCSPNVCCEQEGHDNRQSVGAFLATRKTTASFASSSFDQGEDEVLEMLFRTITNVLFPDTLGLLMDMNSVVMTTNEKRNSRGDDGDDDEEINAILQQVKGVVANVHRRAIDIHFRCWEVTIGGTDKNFSQQVVDLFECPRQHVFLTLDESLEPLPWESLPVLWNHSSSRVPSEGFVHRNLRRVAAESDALTYPPCPPQLPNSSIVLREGVRRECVYYVLNPTGTASSSEERFAPICQEEGWVGLCGTLGAKGEALSQLTAKQLPSSAACRHTKHDLYLYIGHGSGDKLISHHDLTGAAMPVGIDAAVLLMGCSSAKSHCGPGHGSDGMVKAYLHAGAPCVVGCLWDVTDGEIDRMTRDVLLHFFSRQHGEHSGIGKGGEDEVVGRLSDNLVRMNLQSTDSQLGLTPQPKSKTGVSYPNSCGGDKMLLSHAVATSRRTCKFKYLTGAAVVMYGIPCFGKK